MARRIEMSPATRKGIAFAIGALCVCVVGVVLAVGRDDGTGDLQAARSAANALGGGSGQARPGGSTDGSRGLDAAADSSFEKFRACLVEHGITLPERGQQRRAQPDDDLRAAFEACREYLPERPAGPGRGFGPPPGSESPWQPRNDGGPRDGAF